jgi:PEP-CTERM motif-containing protein
MRHMLAATAAVTVLLAFAAPASAATLIPTTGAPLSEMIKNSSGVDGHTIVFTSDPSNLAVDYSSTDILHASSTGGFAFVEGATDAGFSDLTIVPETVTFSAFKFNLHLPATEGPSIPNGYHTTFNFDAQVFFAGGGSQTFDNIDLGNGNGENRFLITAGAGQEIDKIVFSDLVGVSTRNNDPTLTNDFNFDSLRQVSFNAIVPEPATWALFILGFGFIGATLRAARKRGALRTA